MLLVSVVCVDVDVALLALLVTLEQQRTVCITAADVALLVSYRLIIMMMMTMFS